MAEKIALLSHDIRAAMSDVIGGLRLIDTEKIDPATRVQLARVRSSGEVLARLLEDALSAMYDGGDGETHISSKINLSRLLGDLDSRWSGRATAMNLSFTLSAANDLPAIIVTDQIALERILANLLSNAVKYTDRGGVRLTVDLADGDGLRFRVTDDGPGFSDAALDRLFQLRGRPEGAAKPGTGLGLHIAKEMADTIGGKLEVRNGTKTGADVALLLPRDAWQQSELGEAAVAADLPDLSGKHVLIAEDNETNQLLTSQMLETLGATSKVASDGVEAVKMLEQEIFDLALIDIEMPRLNGIGVMQTVRQKDEPLARMPLIALTAYVLRANREAIYAAGADGIIAKPIMSLESFGAALSSFIDRTDPDQNDPNPSSSTSKSFDASRFNRLLEIAGEDGALELLKRLDNDLTRVRNNLRDALPTCDPTVLRAETHVLISLAGAVGADRLHQLAAALNAAAHRNDEAAIVRMGREANGQIDDLLALIDDEKLRRIPAE